MLGVYSLAMRTRATVRGRHSKRTSGFVKACIAFCFITIPSIESELLRLNLYVLGAQASPTSPSRSPLHLPLPISTPVFPPLTSPLPQNHNLPFTPNLPTSLSPPSPPSPPPPPTFQSYPPAPLAPPTLPVLASSPLLSHHSSPPISPNIPPLLSHHPFPPISPNIPPTSYHYPIHIPHHLSRPTSDCSLLSRPLSPTRCCPKWTVSSRRPLRCFPSS